MIREYWKKAAEFHGHECPGLAIGVKLCEYAMAVMSVTAATDEELICIAENDSCSVDAVQALLGCTIGKGNLIYRPTGKQVFTIIRRSDGKACRFSMKAESGGKSREEFLEYLLTAPGEEVFACREVEAKIPEKARIFESIPCEKCGEKTAENRIHLQQGKKLCPDCCEEYTRGW